MNKILFLCTGNSCRSIIGEVVLNKQGKGLFEAFSAGSFPTGQVNPDGIETLNSHGYEVGNVASKSWSDLTGINFDIVITVCDNAASETCPVYLEDAITGHWGIKDPDKVMGSKRQHAFEITYQQLLQRINKLLKLSTITAESINRIGSTSL